MLVPLLLLPLIGAHVPVTIPAHVGVLPHIVPNDNRHPAGELHNGILTLRLVAQDALFFPDGEQGKSFALQAFGEEGKAPTSSAPLIRVVAGTEVRVSVRNAVSRPLLVRGLNDHATPTRAEVNIAPDSTVQIVFKATVPGTYFYYGRTMGDRLGVGAGEDSQLLGAFIVDSAGTAQRASDRVMVMNTWFKPADSRTATPALTEILTINGLSWPSTERLYHTVGDTIHWRVINGSFVWHPMHLHGFYYRVDSRGDELADTVYAPRQRRSAVTEWMRSGTTMAMTWSPTRPGNWLFHCHLILHIGADRRLSPLDHKTAAHSANHATDEMAGLVMGIHVEPRAGRRVVRQDALPPQRTLRLYANSRPNVFGTKPAYSFVLQEGSTPPAADSIRIPGTPIHLTRGERTRIIVVNRTPVPISVHWHGIELDSYYDGVGGWSGDKSRLAPVIAANDSFVVRFIADRSGTFIYHTHADESKQLNSGLYGPLLVAEPGQPIDTTTNRIFLLGLGGPGDESPPWVNGSSTPTAITLEPGRTYRFRLINITPNGREDVVLRADSVVQQWRAFAKDGASLPEWQATMRPAQVHMGAGETTDFEFTPTRPGDLVLESTIRSLGIPPKVVRQSIVVRARE